MINTNRTKKLKTVIKGTPETGLQIPDFHKQRNQSGGRVAQDRQRRRKEMNEKLEFIKLGRSAYKSCS